MALLLRVRCRRTSTMRKRKYAHSMYEKKIPDHLTEDIDHLYACLESSAKVPRTSTDTIDTPQQLGATSIDSTGVPKASIHNLVATARIFTNCASFDLHTISRLLPNCTYDKQKFAAITVRQYDPRCTILLFTSGKMVLTGCNDYGECCLASLNIVTLLRVHLPHFYFTLQDVTIQNIVGNVDLCLGGTRYIDLQKMYTEENIYCTYQKNMFPGLIYRANSCPVVLLLFYSGKIVITGGKSRRDILDGWTTLWPVVKQYISLSNISNESKATEFTQPPHSRKATSACSPHPND